MKKQEKFVKNNQIKNLSRIFYKQFIEIAKNNPRNIPNDFCLDVDIQQVSQSNVYDNNKI